MPRPPLGPGVLLEFWGCYWYATNGLSSRGASILGIEVRGVVWRYGIKKGNETSGILLS